MAKYKPRFHSQENRLPAPGHHGALRGSPRRTRLAWLACVGVAAWLAVFDVAETRGAAAIAPPSGRILITSDLDVALGEVGGGSIVAEYAPVSIDSLPLRSKVEDRDLWDATAGGLTLVTKGVLARGQTLSGALRQHGIPSATIHLISREMRGVFDFRHAQPGHRFRIAQDADGNLLDFRYTTNPEQAYRLSWEGEDGGYVARVERAPLRTEVAKIAGIVDRSLFEAIELLGEGSALASSFTEIFAWDIDFSRSVRSGDEFQVMYERLYRTNDDGEEVYVRPGRILAARYRGATKELEAVYFEGRDGDGGYFRRDGTSMKKAFLVAPLEYRRISSAFSNARRHPILGITRPHQGVDYAAAKGTPVWAVADGTVIHRGWAGASGNLVKIKHRSGYVSYYAHLSRFEPGLKVGSRVTQKQRIGYVGSTGLSTGPHVCFRIQKNDRYVNPLDIVMPIDDGIDRRDWADFKARRDLLLADLGSATLVAADEAL